jgi:hypothetical protein
VRNFSIPLSLLHSVNELKFGFNLFFLVMISLRGLVSKADDEKWEWKGVWAFGSLPDHVARDLDSLNVKIPNVRPFHYTWERNLNAKNVEIPSQRPSPNETEPKEKDDTQMDNVSDGVKMQDIPNDKSSVVKENETVIVDSGTENEINSTVLSNTESTSDIKQKSDELEKVSPDTIREVKDDLPSVTFQTSVENVPNDQVKQIITFGHALPDGPAYTEACTSMNCPPDGEWDGYFENVIRGRKLDNRVSESVSLFWNATPPKDAKATFFDEGESDTFMAESGRVLVRGMGMNQFGEFELLGVFDDTTNILDLQRIYISTPKTDVPKSSPTKKTSGARKSTSSRSYSTRKRKLSWQRRSTLSDDEDEIVGMQRHISNKKKKVTPITAPERNDTTVSPRMESLKSPSLVSRASSSGENVPPKKTSPSSSTNTELGNKKNNVNKFTVSAKSVPKAESPSPPGFITLPTVGDPDEARWRAAHFLYYQRNESITEDNVPPTINFVVYEGEMLQGDSMRHGRGICLYNNGTLYEGEWKLNREHGKGTLMTSNRRRIIYSGEWERGRIHGHGIYYYGTKELDYSIPTGVTFVDITPRYEGEFKENSRHGTGKYFLPDGSTYDGEWRENQMSGRGTFAWPDGSRYTGHWKDGKRHGQGLLEAADKFTYDGMWVYNTMEGRGIAEYPGGQKYEGLWANGRREGRGTIYFVNGAVYEGRFRDDAVEGQGTMKMIKSATVPKDEDNDLPEDWMIPISFQSDMGRIHQKAGFTSGGE